MNIKIHDTLKPVDEIPFEIVERKGIGHPDTLADGIAEKISIEYSKHCLKNFGVILHHNVDKIAITGGLVDIDFGKGKMIKPVMLTLNGRMSTDFAGKEIDTKKIQTNTAKKYIQKVLPHMDVNNWLDILYMTNSYSHNPYWYHPRGLNDIPDATKPYANDTATCVGYWPLSVSERVTLAMEGYFYNEDASPKFQYIGQDIKVMSIRNGNKITAILCVPFISTATPDSTFYIEKLKTISTNLTALASGIAGRKYEVEVCVNPDTNKKTNHYYTLLTGSCIEAGEEGVVGRGNKAQGTISSIRPYSMEAPNGKNPQYFVGKVHQAICNSLAKEIGQTFSTSCNVFMCAKIKEDLYNPNTLIIEMGRKITQTKILRIVEKMLTRRDWTDKILKEEIFVPKPGYYYLEKESSIQPS